MTILLYGNDHRNKLPGPAPLGILPYYQVNTGPSLAPLLAPYFNLPDQASLEAGRQVVVPLLVDPAFQRFHPALDGVPHYVQNTSVPGVLGGRPLGVTAVSAGQNNTEPMTLSQLDALGGAARIWAITNADQGLTSPQVVSSTWFRSLPPEPLYGETRLRLFFDGHVESVSANAP